MIRKELFVATIMTHPAEFGKFAHAYGSYCGELKKAHKRMKIDTSFADEADCNPAVTRMVNWAASELFNLNKLCKKIRGVGFINGFVSDEDKEYLINKVYEIVTDLSAKEA